MKNGLPKDDGKPFTFQNLLVGAVGIEFIKAQNLKELCGMCCSRTGIPRRGPRLAEKIHGLRRL